ncbi:MAG: ABC-2 family transporter protein [bacterium]|nr:MAG: ABC-2 family transporter protein [bacterium]
MDLPRAEQSVSAALTRYWFAFRLVFQERMAYRVNFFLEVLSGIFASLIVVFLWLAVYRSSGTPRVGGFSLAEMITYLLGGGLINTFILTAADNPESSRDILEGDLSGLLIRPMSPYGLWFARDAGSKVFLLILGGLGYAAVLLVFRKYLLGPAGPVSLALTLALVATAALVQFFLFQGLNMLAFWVEQTYGFLFVMRIVMEVVGGAIIPLSFFPDIVQRVFMATPFPYMVYIPMQTWLGRIGPGEAAAALGRSAAWAVALGLINLVLWRRGVRQYVSMGD